MKTSLVGVFTLLISFVTIVHTQGDASIDSSTPVVPSFEMPLKGRATVYFADLTADDLSP
jgi:hypothetical protein